MKKIVYDKACLAYSLPGHLESPDRVRRAFEYLRPKYQVEKAKPAKRSELLLVHSESHVSGVQKGLFSNPDCPRYANIYNLARLAAGAAIQACQMNGLALMRPPGHHAANNRLAGFCYFNNIAIAVKASQKPTLIIDIDGHHGDGTQEIFLGDKQVVYVSLHRSPCYPGTGHVHEQNCYNYPLPPDCGDVKYLHAFELALRHLDVTGIEQVAVSAGFDAHYKDPLASLGLTSEAYKEIGQMIAGLKLPTFAILEGGYVVDDLGENIGMFLQGINQ